MSSPTTPTTASPSRGFFATLAAPISRQTRARSRSPNPLRTSSEQGPSATLGSAGVQSGSQAGSASASTSATPTAASPPTPSSPEPAAAPMLITPGRSFSTATASTADTAASRSSSLGSVAGSLAGPYGMPRSERVRSWVDDGELMARSRSAGSDGSERSASYKANERTEWERIACGRHSSDWIFGGISLSGAVKGVWRKNSDGS